MAGSFVKGFEVFLVDGVGCALLPLILAFGVFLLGNVLLTVFHLAGGGGGELPGL